MRKLKTHRTSTIDFNPVWINTNSCCEANWRNAVQTYKWMLSLRVLPFAFSLFLHQKQKQRVDCLHPSNTLPYHLFLQNVESYALKMLFSTVLHFRSCWKFSARCLLHFSSKTGEEEQCHVHVRYVRWKEILYLSRTRKIWEKSKDLKYSGHNGP